MEKDAILTATLTIPASSRLYNPIFEEKEAELFHHTVHTL
jgi:hypothetical protein